MGIHGEAEGVIPIGVHGFMQTSIARGAMGWFGIWIWYVVCCCRTGGEGGRGGGANLDQVLPRELLPFDRAFWGGRRSREETEAKVV